MGVDFRVIDYSPTARYCYDSYMTDCDKWTTTTAFVCRNFNIGDRVRGLFKKNWYEGTVVDKKKEWSMFDHEKDPGDYRSIYVFIKTDEKVDDSPDALYDGYGLMGLIHEWGILFADEPEGGDPLYDKAVERDLTPEEIEEIKEEMKNVPF